MQRNTFQVVVITDGVDSFVLFNYGADGLQWSGRKNRHGVVGYTTSDGTLFFNHPRSATPLVVLIDNDTLLSNVDVAGRLFYRLSNSQSRCAPVTGCVQWYLDDIQINGLSPLWFRNQSLPPCPCTFFQALQDRRFSFVRRTFDAVCFQSFFPSAFGAQTECCYRVSLFFFFRIFFFEFSDGSLITGPTDGGSANRYNSFFSPTLHVQFDLDPFQDCCVDSRLCHLYYQRRPSRSWQDYSPPDFGE